MYTYRRGASMLLVSANRAIPGASKCGTSDRHRFPRLLFCIYLNLLFEPSGSGICRTYIVCIMSQNKTVVPGMESGNSFGGSYSNDFYSKSTQTPGVSKGTVVPGMNKTATGQQQVHSNHSQPTPRHPGKPVAGFLYSISRQGIGEYWPLYRGQNTIGSSPKCDICLSEGTVSGEHAVLVVRQLKNPEKTIASINDARSTNGTMINGESLGFSAVECFNGDIITIGENYELVLILVDVKALGLKIAENFIPLNQSEPEYEEDDIYTPDYNKHTQPGNVYPPHFDPQSSVGYYGNKGTDGTVGMDGTGGIKSGGTVGM